MTDAELSDRSRVLAAAIEPVIGSVYFAPECHANYAALGFGPSPGTATGPWASEHWGQVALPDGAAYFCSRGSILGQVPGEVIAATFGVFNPAIVVPLVAHGWSLTDAATIAEARTEGAVAQLTRILGTMPAGIDRAVELLGRANEPLSPAGRPLYAGLLALGVPDDPVGAMWRLGDCLREYRGDAHVAAFRAADFDGCEIQVLTERCAGMPPRSYAAGRGWTDHDLGAAESRLAERGLLAGDDPSDHGRDVRDAVERDTDRACSSMVTALGDGLPELVRLLQGWGTAIRAAAGYYPSSPQEAIHSPGADEWLVQHGLRPSHR